MQTRDFPSRLHVAATFAVLFLVCSPTHIGAQVVGRSRPLAARPLTPAQMQRERQVDAMITEMEAQADMVEAVQRACDGPWRYRDPRGEASYRLEIGKLRFTARGDTGGIGRGLADPVDEATVQLIDEGTTGDEPEQQRFMKCEAGVATITDEQTRGQVTLYRP